MGVCQLALYDGSTGALIETRDLDADGKIVGEPLSTETGQWLYLYTEADDTLRPIGYGGEPVTQVVRFSNSRVPQPIPFDSWSPFAEWDTV